jgi:transcriptional regulator with XRE-family HTH domain
MEENTYLNRLKVALVERQKTSKWLAEQMNKSEATISRWASNKTQPSVEQLFEIAKHLNMDVKDLLNTNMSHKE